MKTPPTVNSQPCLSANDLAASSLSKLSPASPTLAYGSPVDVQPINGFSHLKEFVDNKKMITI